MSNWPELDELKQLLDITSTDWDGDSEEYDTTRLSRLLEAAIGYVKFRVGDWDEELDIPTANQAQAALRMGELLATRPERTPGSIHDPTFEHLMVGQRRRFGFA